MLEFVGGRDNLQLENLLEGGKPYRELPIGACWREKQPPNGACWREEKSINNLLLESSIKATNPVNIF
jgi:hypothetical protein